MHVTRHLCLLHKHYLQIFQLCCGSLADERLAEAGQKLVRRAGGDGEELDLQVGGECWEESEFGSCCLV